MSAWDPGDRVEIDSAAHSFHGELGRIVGPGEFGEWRVLLDEGSEVEAYSDELNGVIVGGKS